MASDMDMSLEDIIKKRGNIKRNEKLRKLKQSNKQVSAPTTLHPTSDARNKIISKKRTQIVDAREKLAELAKQKDARFKLEQMRMKKMAMGQSLGRKYGFLTMHDDQWPHLLHHNPHNRERAFFDTSRQVSASQLYLPGTKIHVKRQVPKKRSFGARSVESRTLDYRPHLKPILRTVENDVIVIDPIDVDTYQQPKKSLERKANLNLKIIAHNTGVREKNITVRRTLEQEKVKDRSPTRPPSILKKRPMAALRSEKRAEKLEPSTSSEYRIIVSNLKNTVTGSDIQELFGDIGGLLESRLVRPGTAEVIYKNLQDAQTAVDLYHNRQLDGQPMNCLLVNPRPTNNTSSRASGLPASSSSNVEPDLSTFHKVLFSNF